MGKKKGICFLLLFFLCVSCKKYFTHTASVDSNLKKDFSFKQGSYWIMTDSITGRSDSFFVSHFSDEYDSHGVGFEDYVQENINIIIQQKNISLLYNSDTCTYFLKLKGNSISFTYAHSIAKTIAEACDYFGIFFSYPFQTGMYIMYNDATINDSSGSPLAVVTSVMNTAQPLAALTVNNNTFSSVMNVNYTSSLKYIVLPQAGISYDSFYLNADAGLLKLNKFHPDNSVSNNWELQRWHLVK